jgi:hypothetical protein
MLRECGCTFAKLRRYSERRTPPLVEEEITNFKHGNGLAMNINKVVGPDEAGEDQQQFTGLDWNLNSFTPSRRLQ